MKKQKRLSTSLFGVSRKDIETHLALVENEHEASVSNLTEKLDVLEKAIVAQNEEMKNLQELLSKPDMQQSFIALAEQLLSRFEKVMEKTVRDNHDPNRKNEQENRLRLQYLVDKTINEDIVDIKGVLLLRKGEAISADVAAMLYRHGMVEQLVKCMAD